MEHSADNTLMQQIYNLTLNTVHVHVRARVDALHCKLPESLQVILIQAKNAAGSLN